MANWYAFRGSKPLRQIKKGKIKKAVLDTGSKISQGAGMAMHGIGATKEGLERLKKRFSKRKKVRGRRGS